MPDVHFGPDTCTYRGAPADFVANISLSYAGDMQLELIEPVSGDSIYSEFLRDSAGRRTAPRLRRAPTRRLRRGADGRRPRAASTWSARA